MPKASRAIAPTRAATGVPNARRQRAREPGDAFGEAVAVQAGAGVKKYVLGIKKTSWDSYRDSRDRDREREGLDCLDGLRLPFPLTRERDLGGVREVLVGFGRFLKVGGWFRRVLGGF